MDYPTADGPMRVLDGINYEIRQGEFVSVIGPRLRQDHHDGTGGGFGSPPPGRVPLDGQPVGGPGPDRGVIFQEYGVFPWLTVSENIAFGLNLRSNRVAAGERRRSASASYDP